MSRLTNGAVGHDAVTDLLNRLQGDNRTLWQRVKPLIRQIQEPDGVLLTDDSNQLSQYNLTKKLPLSLVCQSVRYEVG